MRPSVSAPDGLLLALETGGDVCGVAATRDGQFLAEVAFRHEMHLSERLMGHLDTLLKDCAATLADVRAFAVGIGPGSFTGTRIGVMTLKTLAAVLEKPVYGVSGLDALAAEYAGLRAAVVAPMLPCRAGVVYTRLFRVETPAPEPLAEPAALPIAELAARLAAYPDAPLLCCGPAAARYTAELRSALGDSADRLSVGAALFPRAALIARLADLRRAFGDTPDDPLALVPLYISPPPITLPKQPIPS
jgi:tRNA threonylcarbamoyladenosine biosynthesis protein TsaB